MSKRKRMEQIEQENIEALIAARQAPEQIEAGTAKAGVEY
jgi:hypothetical protein